MEAVDRADVRLHGGLRGEALPHASPAHVRELADARPAAPRSESNRDEEDAWKARYGIPFPEALRETPWENDAVSPSMRPRSRRTAEMPAGFFAAYHIYPNYPDFLERQKRAGAAYLADLKRYHGHQPLLVAEFGISTAAASRTSNRTVGTTAEHDERRQGETRAVDADHDPRDGLCRRDRVRVHGRVVQGHLVGRAARDPAGAPPPLVQRREPRAVLRPDGQSHVVTGARGRRSVRGQWIPVLARRGVGAAHARGPIFARLRADAPTRGYLYVLHPHRRAAAGPGLGGDVAPLGDRHLRSRSEGDTRLRRPARRRSRAGRSSS